MPTGDAAAARPAETPFKRLRWNYVFGWLFLVVLAWAGNLLSPVFGDLGGLLDRVVPSAPPGLRIVAFAVALVIIPLVAGVGANILLRFFQGRRNVQAVLQLQEKLFSTVEPGATPAFQVALLDWPNPDVKTLGLVTGTFKAESGQELAAVYMPGTPGPSKGSLKVVSLDSITITDWTVSDIQDFHYTFGSVSPTTC